MDGLDISAIEKIDQDIFNSSPSDDDEDEELPLPDCIGVDSALQDDEETRLQTEKQRVQSMRKSRDEEERKLELQVLRPNSIRGQIFEQSVKNDQTANQASVKTRSHVMNIIEKAGMSGIDKGKINQIIHEASKGSLFYKRQAQRQAEIHKSIEKMLNRIKAATPMQIEKAQVTCDKLVQDLEKQRTFNRVIVHFDLDMFFAAVEIRDNPDLKDKPVAVGGESMVSTSNYIARKFGVRAAMPGFIAKKLCPELILIKPNGFKYREASSEVFAILEEYDPELTGMSLDEAYLDLTEYIKNTLERDNLEYQEYYDGTLPKIWWTRASEVVEEIRQAIFDKTKLTCSGGIACNTLLAKISTDINKPNGQFMVQGYPRDVIDFISKTPVEKVSGIGKVSAQFLNALEIKTCGDIYAKRHFLPLVFYEINVKFYLRVALGDGSTSIKSDEQRKSKSVERTFSAIKDTLILLDKLDSICEELCSKYLKPYRIRGRTVTVKLKRNTFMTTTKSYSMLVPTNDKSVIYSTAKNLLLSEIANEPPEISYRLLGVRLSNLADDGVATNQLTIDAMLRNQEMGKSTKSETSVHQVEALREETTLGEDDDNDAEDLDLPADLTESSKTTPEPEDNQTPEPQLKKLKTNSKICSATKTIDSFFSGTGKQDTSSALSSKDHQRYGADDYGDEQFFDVSKRNSAISTDLNELSQREQLENLPHEELFQCPYCFKSYIDFDCLERHVESCKMKIPIDVNRSFFSQKPQPRLSPAGAFFSQFKNTPTPNKSAKGRASQHARFQQTRQSMRVKRQPRNKSPTTLASFNSCPDQSQISLTQGPGTARKLSFYERFLESNSQKLRLSTALEPFQCPYCLHGFISFPSLESHAVMCTKKHHQEAPSQQENG